MVDIPPPAFSINPEAFRIAHRATENLGGDFAPVDVTEHYPLDERDALPPGIDPRRDRRQLLKVELRMPQNVSLRTIQFLGYASLPETQVTVTIIGPRPNGEILGGVKTWRQIGGEPTTDKPPDNIREIPMQSKALGKTWHGILTSLGLV